MGCVAGQGQGAGEAPPHRASESEFCSPAQRRACAAFCGASSASSRIDRSTSSIFRLRRSSPVEREREKRSTAAEVVSGCVCVLFLMGYGEEDAWETQRADLAREARGSTRGGSATAPTGALLCSLRIGVASGDARIAGGRRDAARRAAASRAGAAAWRKERLCFLWQNDEPPHLQPLLL